MEHERYNQKPDRPPLRTFLVRTVRLDNTEEDIRVSAHLVFNNTDRGEGLVFRRYYDDNVRTEKVAEFQPGYWVNYRELT